MLQRMALSKVLLFIGSLSVLMSSACSSAAVPEKAADGGSPGPVGKAVVTLAPQTTGHIDPQIGGGAADTPNFENVYDRLLQALPGNLELKPSVASKWTMSPDAKTFTFEIRKDVRFHDGSMITPEDVLFSVDRLLKLGRPDTIATHQRFVESVQIQGDSVVFKLKEPDWTFTASGTAYSIVPKKYIEKVGDEGFLKAPVGSGPFKVTGWSKQEFLGMEAIDYTHFQRQPGVKTLRQVIVPEETTRLAMLRTGEADLAQVSVTSLKSLTEVGGLRAIKAPEVGAMRLALFGQGDPQNPMSKLEVRQALSLAIDREAIAKGIYQGYARPLSTWLWNPQRPEFPEWGNKVPEYNLEKAKQLLAKAGYPDGKGFPKIFLHNYEYGPMPLWTQVAPVVAAQWQKLGVPVELRQWEFGAWGPAQRETPTKLPPVSVGTSISFGSGDKGSIPDLFLEYIEAAGIAAGAHQELHKWVTQYMSELDPNIRKQLQDKIVTYDRDNIVFMPMFVQDQIWGAGPRLLEYIPKGASGPSNMWTIKVKPE